MELNQILTPFTCIFANTFTGDIQKSLPLTSGGNLSLPFLVVVKYFESDIFCSSTATNPDVANQYVTN